MEIYKINECGFMEVDISKEMFSEAETRNKIFESEYGTIGTHRIDKPKQRMTGYLAEISIKKVYEKLKFSDNPEVDFLYNKYTFDSKSQGCNTQPLNNYVATLYEEQKNRNVNFYIFSRTKNDFKKVWINGFISKNNFFKNSKLIQAGTINNNFKYDQSRYELEYKYLIKPILLKEFLDKK